MASNDDCSALNAFPVAPSGFAIMPDLDGDEPGGKQGLPDKAPMTIRSVPRATRETIIACAKRRDQTVAEWLVDAVTVVAGMQAGDRIDPAMFDPAVPCLTPRSECLPDRQTLVLDDVHAVLAALSAVSAATGMPIPKTAARHCYALLTAHVRAARGLPPLAPRQTRGEKRQTIAGTDVSPGRAVRAEAGRLEAVSFGCRKDE
jgi:hypothetical protein